MFENLRSMIGLCQDKEFTRDRRERKAMGFIHTEMAAQLQKEAIRISRDYIDHPFSLLTEIM